MIKMKLKKSTIITLAIFALVFLTACSTTTYVCYDGTQQKDAKLCPTYPHIKLSESKVAQISDNYARAYSLSTGFQYTKVSIYPQGGDWFSDVLFSDRGTENVYPVKLKIDGRTSSVTCIDGCASIGIIGNVNQTTNSSNTTAKK